MNHEQEGSKIEQKAKQVVTALTKMKPMIEDVKNDIDKQEQGKEDLMTKFE